MSYEDDLKHYLKSVENDYKVIHDKLNYAKLQNPSSLDPATEALRKLATGVETRDLIVVKSAIFEFIKEAVFLGLSIRQMAYFSGIPRGIWAGYYKEYKNYLAGVMGDQNLSIDKFTETIDRLDEQIGIINNIVRTGRLVLEKAIRGEKLTDIETAILKHTSKAAEISSSIEIKKQDLLFRSGIHSNLDNYFNKGTKSDYQSKAETIREKLQLVGSRKLTNRDMMILQDRMNNINKEEDDI